MTSIVQVLAFTYLAVLAVVAALATVSLRNPIHCALGLVMVVFHVAGLFVLMGNGFIAAVQVIVYAGAIIVLFLFTMMLLDLRQQGRERTFHTRQLLFAFPLAALLFIETAWVAASRTEITSAMKGAFPPSRVDELGGSAQALAEVLFNAYLLPFEVASVLLLAAAIGALVLARRVDEDRLAAPPSPVADAAGQAPADGGEERLRGSGATATADHGEYGGI